MEKQTKELLKKGFKFKEFLTKNQYVDTTILKEPIYITYHELENRFRESEKTELEIDIEELRQLTTLRNGLNFNIRFNPYTNLYELPIATKEELIDHILLNLNYLTIGIKANDLL